MDDKSEARWGHAPNMSSCRVQPQSSILTTEPLEFLWAKQSGITTQTLGGESNINVLRDLPQVIELISGEAPIETDFSDSRSKKNLHVNENV